MMWCLHLNEKDTVFDGENSKRFQTNGSKSVLVVSLMGLVPDLPSYSLCWPLNYYTVCCRWGDLRREETCKRSCWVEMLSDVRMFTCVALAADKGFEAYCIAQYDYAASERNQLSISVHDVIGILNKAGDSQGWWKGYLNGRVSL